MSHRHVLSKADAARGGRGNVSEAAQNKRIKQMMHKAIVKLGEAVSSGDLQAIRTALEQSDTLYKLAGVQVSDDPVVKAAIQSLLRQGSAASDTCSDDNAADPPKQPQSRGDE